MNDSYIEKRFLYLIIVSLLLHFGAFAGLYFFPQPKKELPKEPVFVDLQQVPDIKPQPRPPQQQETKRQSEQRVRIPRETAPRGTAVRDSQPSAKPAPRPQVEQREQQAASASRPASKPVMPLPADNRESQVTPGSSASSLLKPKSQAGHQTSQPQLYPAANRLAKLEENYRRKFEKDIAEGDTRFLNSDDILFGSFLRRFEGAVYGVWRYPQEAAIRGIEGVTPVRITFNRRGDITNIQQLESSGARILDDEVIRTLRAIGPLGGFPKGYDKDEFHLIAFFQYGGARRALR